MGNRQTEPSYPHWKQEGLRAHKGRKTPPASGSVVSRRLLRRLGKRKNAQEIVFQTGGIATAKASQYQPHKAMLEMFPDYAVGAGRKEDKRSGGCAQHAQVVLDRARERQQVWSSEGRARLRQTSIFASLAEDGLEVGQRAEASRMVDRWADFLDSLPPLPSLLVS